MCDRGGGYSCGALLWPSPALWATVAVHCFDPLRPCGLRLRYPVFAARVTARLQKADRCPCSASAVSSAGRASASQSRTRGRPDL